MLTKDERAIELKNVWVFECWHDLYSGIQQERAYPALILQKKKSNRMGNIIMDGMAGLLN